MAWSVKWKVVAGRQSSFSVEGAFTCPPRLGHLPATKRLAYELRQSAIRTQPRISSLVLVSGVRDSSMLHAVFDSLITLTPSLDASTRVNVRSQFNRGGVCEGLRHPKHLSFKERCQLRQNNFRCHRSKNENSLLEVRLGTTEFSSHIIVDVLIKNQLSSQYHTK